MQSPWDIQALSDLLAPPKGADSDSDEEEEVRLMI
jgi:hypothetical protein